MAQHRNVILEAIRDEIRKTDAEDVKRGVLALIEFMRKSDYDNEIGRGGLAYVAGYLGLSHILFEEHGAHESTTSGKHERKE